MLDKVRPNVILLGLILAGLSYGLMHMVSQWNFVPDMALIASVFLLIGVALGAFASVMTKVAEDPPPPVYPAGPLNDLIAEMRAGNSKAE